MTSSQFAAVSVYVPRGLPKSVAFLARSVLSPIPTEQCRPVAARTDSMTSAAMSSGSPRSPCSGPGPTNASSQPSTCTSTGTPPQVRDRRVSMTVADTASYAGASTGRNTASGHLRFATRSGMPEPTPNSRAS